MPATPPPPLEPYDVLLLAGSPRRHNCTLRAHIEEGELIDLEGEQWTVADVRTSETETTRLICIYAA